MKPKPTPKQMQKEKTEKKKKRWRWRERTIAFDIVVGWYCVKENSPKRPTWHTHNDIESLIYIEGVNG